MLKEIDNRFPVRKNPRLPQFDYSAPNYYFITICTYEKSCLFGTPGQLNRYGKIAAFGLQEISKHFSSIRLDIFVVMPNHVHAIVVLEKSDYNLSNIIGQYKSFVSREIHKINPEIKVWQTSFHDHVIRNDREYQKIWQYIQCNEQKWELDCFYPKESTSKR